MSVDLDESLRERKKRRTRVAILDAAARMAAEKGLEAVTVRGVAREADLSEASFFNYFRSRDVLFSEWAHREIANAFAQAAERASAEPERRLRSLLRTSLRTLAAGIESERDLFRELWRRASILAESTGRGSDRAPRRALEDWIEGAQRRGELRGDVAPAQLARLLHGAAAMAVAAALVSDSESPAVEPALLAAVDLVLDGSRKRNERVRVRVGVGARGVAVPPARSSD
jgi:AcrR family transcriptional regulator